jgi:hypothetical protein
MNSTRLLSFVAFQYADARTQQLKYRGQSDEWLDGYHGGRAQAALGVLRNFLKDVPRKTRHAIGAKIRSEVEAYRRREAAYQKQIERAQDALRQEAASIVDRQIIREAA